MSDEEQAQAERLEEQKEQRTKIRHRFKFDGTINLGHIFIMLGMIGTACGLWVNTEVRLDAYDLRIDHVETNAKTQTQTLQEITTLQRSMQMIEVQQTDAINTLKERRQ